MAVSYASAKPYFYGTGRRKSSVARVRLFPGTGNITINGQDIDKYFGLETLKLIINQPFDVTDTRGKFDIVANGATSVGITNCVIVRNRSMGVRLGVSSALNVSVSHCTIADNGLLGFRDERFDDLTGGREKLKDYLSCVDRAACLELFGLYRDRTHTTY